MDDFETTLIALGEGRLRPELLQEQISKLIRSKPELADTLLSQLKKAHSKKHIDDQTYTSLRNHINQCTQASDGDDTAEGEEREKITRRAIDLESATQLGERREYTRLSDDGADTPTEIDRAMAVAHGTETGAPTTMPPEPQDMAEPTGPVRMGHVLKRRFKLLEVLGEGHMSMVYKGIDLLKQEARDKNPYVAIKLLNESFQEHPEAFTALQRESSRQQKLAHPNIATVYDFDRIGSDNTQVFITMELLHGEPLNTYIKSKVKPKNGLPFQEAFPIIQGLGNALIHAHDNRIVHSDFRPDNSFLGRDGTVKVLNFGIARIVEDNTLFDPGKLDTPISAYASLEMLGGEDPDPRDDIYALGCVSYELLTGTHPYDKMPANTARDNKKTPPLVKGLKRRQQKALARSVAFGRENRSPSVAHFLENLEAQFTWYKDPLVMAGAIAFVIAISLIYPATNYLHQRRLDAHILSINEIGNDYIGSFLRETLPALESTDRNRILDEARASLQAYFEHDVQRAVNPGEKRYDFSQAQKILDEASLLFPDSRWLSKLAASVEDDRNQVLYDLNRQYISYLEQGNLIESADEDEITDVLAVIRSVDPEHPLLRDRRLSNAYLTIAENAVSRGDVQEALAYVEAGLRLAPRDARLLNLRDVIWTDLHVAELTQTLSGSLASLTDIRDYEPITEQIVELARLRPSVPLLAEISTMASGHALQELERILSEGSRADADAANAICGNLLTALNLGREATELRLAHLTGAEREAASERIIGQSRAALGRLLADAQPLDSTWEQTVQSNMQQLGILLPAADASLTLLRENIASVYTPGILEAAKDNRYNEAYALVIRAENLSGQSGVLDEVVGRIGEMETEFNQRKEEDVRVDGLKNDILTQIRARDVAAAEQTLAELIVDLPADDPFLATELPREFETAYLRLVADHAARNDYAPWKGCTGTVQSPGNGATISAQENKHGDTALLLAACQGHAHTVQLLLDNGADINARDNGGYTALLSAAHGGHAHTVQLLLDNGADINARDNGGYTALLSAAHGGHADTVQLLLDDGVDIDARDNGGDTALIWAAHDGHADTIQLLLDNGADIGVRNNDGHTVLIPAVRKGHTDTAQLLLDNGADIDARDKYGNTALLWAARKGHTDTVQLLLDNHANINARENEHGNTALLLAAWEGHMNTVQLLLDNRADIDARNNDGNTALMGAARKGRKDTVQLLLSNHANIDAGNTKDETALMMAAEEGHAAIVRLLRNAETWRNEQR